MDTRATATGTTAKRKKKLQADCVARGSSYIRRVAVVTGTRAEYGLLKPVMEAIPAAGLDLRVVVTGMHLLPQFGNTVDEIESDGFDLVRVPMASECDSHAAMVQSIGAGVSGLGKAFETIDPDAVLLLGDRVEAFAAAIAGSALNRVVAHLHGGEVTRGGLDESMRHAITKLAHLHFPATKKSGDRIVRMGERPDRVFVVGAPGLDVALNVKPLTEADLQAGLGVLLRHPLVVLIQHPVTTHADSAASEVRASLEALESLGHQTICIYPNSDPGGRRMIDVIESFRGRAWLHIVPSLPHRTYLSLLRRADVLVGNTSSAIIEAPCLQLAAVNIGERQQGRERGDNVIDCEPTAAAVRAAVERALRDESFHERVRQSVSPYGDGHAGTRIAMILSDTAATRDLLQKQLTYE